MVFYLLLMAAFILADQLTKHLAVVHLMGSAPVKFLEGILQLRYTQNTGASFSLFSEHTGALALFGAVFIGLLFFFWKKLREKNALPLLDLSFAMILAGAIGNLIDRVRLGYVIDFLEPTFMEFAVFNVADCFITVGAALFCALVIFEKKLEL